jgi:hypothetical protein
VITKSLVLKELLRATDKINSEAVALSALRMNTHPRQPLPGQLSHLCDEHAGHARDANHFGRGDHAIQRVACVARRSLPGPADGDHLRHAHGRTCVGNLYDHGQQ